MTALSRNFTTAASFGSVCWASAAVCWASHSVTQHHDRWAAGRLRAVLAREVAGLHRLALLPLLMRILITMALLRRTLIMMALLLLPLLSAAAALANQLCPTPPHPCSRSQLGPAAGGQPAGLDRVPGKRAAAAGPLPAQHRLMGRHGMPCRHSSPAPRQTTAGTTRCVEMALQPSPPVLMRCACGSLQDCWCCRASEQYTWHVNVPLSTDLDL